MLEEASALLAQKNEAETKQQLLDAFNKHFVLSDDDLNHLTATNSGVDDQFFSLLGRLKRIHADCQVLLGYENQRLGLELMDRSSRHLNSAFQKLFRWIQSEFKILDLENPRMNASIRRALRVLAERPALFQNCLDYFAEARERNLSDAFYSALTGSNTQTDDRTAKPMEYYAHDSLRFVGDMLAWTHSAAVSERESLEVLFISEGDEMAKGIQAGIESEPWLQESTEAFDGQRSLEQLVNRDLAGVSKALRLRIEQVIKSDEDSVTAYKVANLIDFYRVTFIRLLGSESTTLRVLTTLHDSAMQQYRTTMRDHASGLPTDPPLPAPPDLRPPAFLSDALARLTEIIKSFDSSFTPDESRDSAFASLLAESLDPFLSACNATVVSIDEPQASVFAINCLLAAKATLSASSSASTAAASRISALDATVDSHTIALVDYQHDFFLHSSGLAPLLAVLTDPAREHDRQPLRDLEPFKPRSLTAAAAALDEFLPSAVVDAGDNIAQLDNKNLASDITAQAAEAFCEDFDRVEEALLDADQEDGVTDGQVAAEVGDQDQDQDAEHERQVSLRALFPRTSGEIRVLLS